MSNFQIALLVLVIVLVIAVAVYVKMPVPAGIDLPPAGVTVAPGQSINLEVPAPLGQALTQLQKEGHVVRIEPGPTRLIGGKYSQEVVITVDQKPYAKFVMGWTKQ